MPGMTAPGPAAALDGAGLWPIACCRIFGNRMSCLCRWGSGRAKHIDVKGLKVTRIMRDSDRPKAIPIHGTDLVAGYVTGPGTWPAGAFARFRGIPHVHIDCRETMPDKAEILDVETGCSDVQTAVVWAKKRKAFFPDAYPPILYCNRSMLPALFNAMGAASLHVVRDFRLWIATLDGTKRLHDMTGVTAVQYKRAPHETNDGTPVEPPSEKVTAGHYDESIVFDDDWHPEDDLPYTKEQILELVKQGVAGVLSAGKTRQQILGMVKESVAEELRADIGTSGISPAQGALAAVHAQDALTGIGQQVTELAALVRGLEPATPPGTGTGRRRT